MKTTSIKKLLAIVLCATLTLATLTVSPAFLAYASGSGVLTVSTGAAVPGEDVTVDVVMEENPGIISLYFVVTWDSNALTLKSYAVDGGVANYASPSHNSNTPGRFIFFNRDDMATSNYTAAGKVVSLTFTVANEHNGGIETLTISPAGGNIYDYNMNLVPFTSSNGAINIVKPLAKDVSVNLIAPVLGGIPETHINGAGYNGAVTWSDNPITFAPNTVYTATVTLTPADAKINPFNAPSTVTINGNSVIPSINTENSIEFTYTFPQTNDKNDVSDTITFNNETYAYDRTPKTLAAATTTDPTGGSFTYVSADTGQSIDLSQTLSGVYSIKAIYDSATAHGEKTAVLTIEKAMLSITGALPVNRDYDKTTTIAITGASLSGVKAGDTVTISEITGTVTNADAEANKPVNVTVTLDGADKDNYSVTTPVDLTVTINAAQLTYNAPETKSVKVGSSLNTFMSCAPNDGTGIGGELVSGMVAWYSDAGCTTIVVDTDVSGLDIGATKTLYWEFTPTSTNYMTRQGITTFTIIEGDPQPMVFEYGNSIEKSYGDAAFINLASHVGGNAGKGEISYSGDNATVATVNATGEVLIVGVGTVIITATAAAVPGEWSESSIEYTLTVEKAAPSAEHFNYTLPEGLIYNGQPQNVTVAVKPALSGLGEVQAIKYNGGTNVPINAGTYALTVDVSDGVNYSSGTISLGNFTISPKALTNEMITITDSYVYSGNTQTPTYAVADNGLITSDDYDATVPTQTNAGTYALTLTGKNNYTGTASSDFIITKLTPTIENLAVNTPTEFEYNGQALSVEVTASSGKTGLGTVIATYYNDSITPPSDAGVYAVSLDIDEGDNYEAVTDLFLGNFTISKAIPTEALLDYDLPKTVSYNNNPQELSVTPVSVVTGLGNITVKYNGSVTAPIDVGVYVITVDIAAGTNYLAATDIALLGTFTISGGDIPADDITVVNYMGVYDGIPHGIVSVVDSGGGTVTYCATKDGMYSPTSPIYTDVGVYNVYFKVKRDGNNYNEYSGLGTVTITKATPDALIWPTATDIMYGDALSTSDLIGGSVTGTWAWVDGSIIPTILNNGYEVTFIPYDMTNYDWSNVALSKNIFITVQKSDALAVVAQPNMSVKEGVARNYIFDMNNIELNKADCGAKTYRAIIDLDGGMLNNVQIYNNILSFDIASPAAIGATASIAIIISSENYIDVTATLTVIVTERDAQTIKFAVPSITKTYGDQKFTVLAELEGIGGAGAITYTSNNTDVASVDPTTGEVTIVGAGSVNITATKAADDNYSEATASYALAVNKKTITITADDKAAKVGENEPSYTCTVTGLLDDENLIVEPTAICPTVNMGIAGNYPIIPSGAEVSINYAINYVNGILTVNPLSTACDIITITSPNNAEINGTNITANVANNVTSQLIAVITSEYADWSLYSDKICTNEITDKTIALTAGINTAYIKVTAEDGITTKIYTVTIIRAIATCIITATAGVGGSVSGGGLYTLGEIITLTAMPNIGYLFDGWYENGSKISNANAIYSFNVTSDRTLEARFKRTLYHLIIAARSGGTVNTDASGDYESGAKIQLIASTKNAGYRFSYWTSSNGGTFANAYNPITTFTMPEANTTVTAVFEYIGTGGNVSGGSDTSGSISSEPSQPIKSSDEIINDQLNRETSPIVDMNSGSITISGSTLLRMLEANKTLTVNRGIDTLLLSPDNIREMNIRPGDSIVINLRQDFTTLITDAAGIDETNNQLLRHFYNISISVNGNEFKTFNIPITIRFNVLMFNLSQAQKNKLTGIRYLGESNYNQLGGKFISKDVFEFKTSKLSKYGVLISDSLVYIATTVDKNTYTVNGSSRTTDVAPTIINDRTMVPLRFIAEAFGANVEWIDSTKSAIIKLDSKTLTMTIDQKLPGMDVAPMIVNSRTVVPLRYISEQIDANVIWNAETRSIEIYR